MLPFVCVFLNFFLQCCVVSWVQVFTSLVRFIPRYFIFLVALSNGIFFSWFLFLLFRCWCTGMPLISEFWLYPAVLPNSFIRSSSFLVESIGFPMYTIMSSANSDSFISSFPIWMPFIAFSCLIAVARSSNTMLNRSGENRCPCLVPDLSGKAFSFAHWVWCWL